jgi:hypothetical protein
MHARTLYETVRSLNNISLWISSKEAEGHVLQLVERRLEKRLYRTDYALSASASFMQGSPPKRQATITISTLSSFILKQLTVSSFNK